MKNKICFTVLAILMLCASCEKDGGSSSFETSFGSISNFSLLPNSSDFIDLTSFNTMTLGFSVDFGVGEKPVSMDLKAFWRTVNGDLYGPVTLDANVTSLPKEYSLTGSTILSAFSELSSSDDLNLGDRLILYTVLTLADGTVLSMLNDQAQTNYYAPDFNAYTELPSITLTYPVSCPSNLGGVYNVISNGDNTDGQPAAVNLAYTVTVTDNGGGNYTISDGVAGVYIYWYSIYGYTFETAGNFSEVCGNLTGSWIEAFNCPVELTGTVNSDGTLSIRWDNCFGDYADAVYTPQ